MVLQLYRKNILKRLQGPGFHWQPFRACILGSKRSVNVPKGLRGLQQIPFGISYGKPKYI